MPSKKYQWLAGIIDAEGSISIRMANKKVKGIKCKSRNVRLRIKTLDDIIVPTIHNYFNHDSINKNVYQVTNNKLRLLLPKIIPYLYTKQPQALLALEALMIKNGQNSFYTDKEDIKWQKIKSQINNLNKRGKDAIIDNHTRNHVFSWPWLAGFIDGDGSITLTKFGKKQLKPIIKISLAHLKTIDYIGSQLGINPIKNGKIRENRRLTKCVRLMSQNQLKFLPNIIPHLTLKQEKAKLALKIAQKRSKIKPGINRGILIDEVNQLIKQFVELP